MNQARKKVLFVITKSNWGGAQRYVFDLATNLPKETFDIAVALGGTGEKNAGEGLLAKRLREAGIRTVFVRSFVRDIYVSSDAGIIFELLRIFKQERPDVVHLNSSKAGFAGAIAGRLAGVPRIIFTAHGWPQRERRNALARAAIWSGSWLTALLATNVICVSDADLKTAQRLPFAAKKAIRIYNGIDLNMTFGSGEAVRSQFPSGAKITGTIGELTRNKNQIALVEQAKNDPRKYVAIVGEGELKAFLDQKIKEYGLGERVKLLGFISAADALKGFDVFALPSLKEGLPYVLVEAKLAGLPIEANRVGGVGEVLDNDIKEFSLEQMLERTKAIYG